MANVKSGKISACGLSLKVQIGGVIERYVQQCNQYLGIWVFVLQTYVVIDVSPIKSYSSLITGSCSPSGSVPHHSLGYLRLGWKREKWDETMRN